MIVCSVDKVAKMYGGNAVFEDISMQIKENERVGLVGRNGSGKTTLMKLLAGEEKQDAGHIHWKKGISIGYLEQIPEYDDETTVRDILKSAFSSLLNIEKRMKVLEREMGERKDPDMINKHIEDYGTLQDEFTINGGYEITSKIESIARGLNINFCLITFTCN